MTQCFELDWLLNSLFIDIFVSRKVLEDSYTIISQKCVRDDQNNVQTDIETQQNNFQKYEQLLHLPQCFQLYIGLYFTEVITALEKGVDVMWTLKTA